MTELQLNTPRLLIDALQAQDRDSFCGLFTDKRTMQFIGRPLSPSRALASFRAALRHNAEPSPRQLFWRIVEKATGGLIGLCSIQRIDLRHRMCELGLMFDSAHQGQGFGREALIALVDALFRLFPIDQISVHYHPGNAVAERLFISSGFRSGARGGADEGGARRRVLSAYRHTWDRPGNAHS